MTDKRRLTLAITLYVTADLSTEGIDTSVGLVAVSHNIMGGLTPMGVDSVPETTEKWRNKVTESATRLALKHMVNEFSGEHAEPAPVVNSPGADA
mgnify:CR=1 FL=1